MTDRPQPQRQSGFFWVAVDEGWEPARWDAGRSHWLLIGSDIPLEAVGAVGRPLPRPDDPLDDSLRPFDPLRDLDGGGA